MADYRKQIERRIKKKTTELEDLDGQRDGLQRQLRTIEMRIREARAAREAFEETLSFLPAPKAEDGPTTELRKGGLPALAYEALTQAGQPLHITDLLAAMGKEPSREARTSLAGSLSAYVRKGEVFSRPEPNTFALIEWGGSVPVDDSADGDVDWWPEEEDERKRAALEDMFERD